MLSVYGGTTKERLKQRVGEPASHVLEETSMFGPEYKGQGSYLVGGPSPISRKWYATVVVDAGGIIVKVS